MRIEDIAKVAEVSISTVSKIVNGKDKGISAKTRERVLAIVKEYNYQPYSSIIDSHRTRSYILGILYHKELRGQEEVIRGIIDMADEQRYNVILQPIHKEPKSELKGVSRLLGAGVDALISTSPESGRDRLSLSGSREIPYLEIGKNYQVDEVLLLDFMGYGYAITKRMIEHGHVELACVVRRRGDLVRYFLDGCRKCLFENHILFDENAHVIYEDEINSGILLRGFTGFLCFDEDLARQIYFCASEKKYQIPMDFSILSLKDNEKEDIYPPISSLPIPFYDFGRCLCKGLVEKLERQDVLPAFAADRFSITSIVHENATLLVPGKMSRKNIIVIGSVHMDNIINVDEVPQAGKTVTVSACNLIPGGKGTNQAVGVAKLGGRVSLIGKIGKDFEGIAVCEALKIHQIDLQGLVSDSRVDTGKAYIYVQKNGESSISTYSGANHILEESDIRDNLSLFQGAGYCLVSTEIPEKIVRYVLGFAEDCRVKTILKPSSTQRMTDEVFQKTHIFVPNQKEANALCAGCKSIEDQADFFLKKGPKQVIITLGGEGCYVKGTDCTGFFPAVNFSVIDTTGGADAFIAALAVFLNEGRKMADAIRYAICAAGFAVTRQGVVPALVDRTTLELYMAKME